MKKFSPGFRKKLALHFHSRFVKLKAKEHELNYMFWECTSRCNIACLHCGSDCKIIENAPDMPAEDFLKVAAQIATRYNPKKVMIVISGGEPLVRKDLPQVGQKLKEMGYPWGIVSNGFAMTPQLFRNLRDAGLRSATISLDGLKEHHDWLRGREGSFERAVEAIQLLVAEENMVYDVVTCVNKRNFSDLENIKNFLVQIGVKRWRLFMIDPIGRAASNPELLLSDDEFKKMLDFIVQNRASGQIRTSFGCDGFLGDWEALVRDGLFFCRAGIQVASVLANGDVCACPNIHRGFVQGNIYKDDFLDVWDNKYKEFRNRKVFKTGICKDCKQWKYCRGEGMHLREPGNHDPIACHFRRLYDDEYVVPLKNNS
jgi:radical SAM enzyme (rSAM/lipoprotein system)